MIIVTLFFWLGFKVILSEGRIIFLSSHLGMLTLASESFLYLLFPLYWQGVYIPILPAALMTCLQAPVPYIIGVERSCCDSDFPPEDVRADNFVITRLSFRVDGALIR